jgi:hypothetical protein
MFGMGWNAKAAFTGHDEGTRLATAEEVALVRQQGTVRHSLSPDAAWAASTNLAPPSRGFSPASGEAQS